MHIRVCGATLLLGVMDLDVALRVEVRAEETADPRICTREDGLRHGRAQVHDTVHSNVSGR